MSAEPQKIIPRSLCSRFNILDVRSTQGPSQIHDSSTADSIEIYLV